MEPWERYEVRARNLGPEDDFFWVAEIPELPGCRAYGASREEALGELTNVARAYVRAAEEDGEVLPQPLSDVPQDHSGTFLLRATPSLHSKLVLRAKAERSSLNKLCCELLAESIGYRDGLLEGRAQVLTSGVASTQEPADWRKVIWLEDCKRVAPIAI